MQAPTLPEQRLIRRITPDDVEEAIAVFRASCGASHAFLKPDFLDKTEKTMRERTLLRWDTYVIEDGGIRGFISVCGGFIDALFVDPRYQGRGYGKALIDHAKSGARALILSVFARNPRAVNFYQREEFWAVAVKEHRETGETIVLLQWQSKGA